MTAYLLSLVVTLTFCWLLHNSPVRIRRALTSCTIVLGVLIAAVSLVLLLIGYIAVPGSYLFSSALIIARSDFAQAVYGAVVGSLLYYWFVVRSFKRLEVAGAVAATAAVVFGFLLPAVGRWPATLTQVSLPFGSLSFVAPDEPKANVVVTGDRNELLFATRPKPEEPVPALMAALSNPDPQKGHVYKDIVFAQVEANSVVESEMAAAARFISDVVQPLFACIGRIEADTGGTYLGGDVLLQVARALRAAVTVAGEKNGDRWTDFRQEYARAQLELLRQIARHNVALDDEQGSFSACRLVVPVFAHPANPFDDTLPYARMTIALLLQAGGQHRAAAHELARWIDNQSAHGRDFGRDVGRPLWFRLRALLYMADLMKIEGDIPAEIFKQINTYFRSAKFRMPSSVDDMRRFIEACEQKDVVTKELALTYVTWIREELEQTVHRQGFGVEVEDELNALNWAEILAEVNFRCFSPPVAETEADRFAAATYVTIAETYLGLVHVNELRDRAGTLEHESWSELARGYLRKAIPLLRQLAEQERRTNANLENGGLVGILNNTDRDQSEYDRVRRRLLELHRTQ